MINEIATIEDLLEILAGLRSDHKIEIEKSDATIMYSIARQVFNGTALTDRQYSLVEEKLQKYKSQFLNEHNFDIAINQLKYPLREIDRSKYIKIVSHEEMVGPNNVYESYKQDWKWIKVRFPFSKKLILCLEKISKKDYHHEKGSHIHYFKFTEKNTYDLVNVFKDKNFTIDTELLEHYSKINMFVENHTDFLPGIKDYTLVNFLPISKKAFENSIGEPSIKNLYKFKDRKFLYGIHFFDEAEVDKSLENVSALTKKIVNRTKQSIFVNNSKFTIEQLTTSISELERYPLLVILDNEDAYEKLSELYAQFSLVLPSQSQSVMFRLDNKDNKKFNDFVRNNNLNNVVDKDTKIVYINKEKIPKPLLKTNIYFNAALYTNSIRPTQRIGMYLNSIDLTIHYDENVSQFMRFQKDGIEEL